MASRKSTMQSWSIPNFLLFSHILSSFVHPSHSLSNDHILTLKRRLVIQSRIVGVGVGLVVLLIVLVGTAFNLGRRRERSCWRNKELDPESKNTTLPELEGTPEPNRIKNRNSWPKPRSISAFVELQSPISPVEVEWRPQYQEILSKEIYEMGSPSVSSRRSSWMSQTTWWARYSDRRKESTARSDQSLGHKEAASIKQPPDLEAARRPSGISYIQEKQRKGSGPTLINRRGSGFEHVRQVYAQKKTDLTVEGTPWY